MLLACLLCYGGFTALCLSMERHYAQLLGRKSSLKARRGLRFVGWLLLGLALWAAVSVGGWAFGLVRWCAVLMLSVLLLVMLMPYRPRMALSLAALSLLCSPIAALATY
jgi:hypothetical protein